MSATSPGGAPRSGPSATISSIAAELGVSVPTVSKVLNGRTDVAPKTRAKVEAALERHQYKRRRRGPAVVGPPLIDLAFHELDSAWSIEIIRGVEASAAAEGVGVVLSEFGGRHRPEQDWLDAVLARRPLGVILVLSGLGKAQQHQFESRSIPFVVVDTAGEPPEDVPTVGSNNWNGGLSATRHLLRLGHRRVAVISGPADVVCSRARVDGFRSAHAEAGLTVDPSLIRYGDFYVDGGYEHGKDLLSRPDRPTAIFAGSDMQALGVLRAARELGLHVPRDLSVVGYDNLPLTEWIGPALTTVNQPLHAMASTATRLLVELSRGEEPELLRVDLATELIVRESTAPPAE
ncbi:LacI family DNA-binding transcriptional regulator [Haloactinopolyspora sp.]|uniref:LacI family DNA-binding transcriptional regulator n=1 Tax=Haloactinopolyspora sp. TaxID=1966353 RepID=UPI0026032661|nr:LacI family DNA-binding transcriptional regulator [Haloactinopolyspora sp.]